MIRIINILFLLTLLIKAESIWELETKPPLNFLSHTVSPDGLTFATLYESYDKVDEGEAGKQYLQIGSIAKSWWLANTTGFLTISQIRFISNTHFLLIENSSTSTVSVIVDIRTKMRKILSNGMAEYITEGKHKGMFIIHNTKSYFPEGGAYWFDELINKDGELIKVLSKPKNEWGCIPLKVILKQSYPQLQQSMDDCVYVDR